MLLGSSGSTSSTSKTAAKILARPNVREGGTGTDRTVVTQTGTNANAREGRTSSGGVASITPTPPYTGGNNTTKTEIKTGNTDNTDLNNGFSSGGGVTLEQMPVIPSPQTASQLGVVKNPTRDITNLSSLIPEESAETITRLLFEQFSAVELSQILTSNTIDGVDQQYSIISNLSDIRRRYNTTKQLTIMDKLAPIDAVYAIDLISKIPGDDYILRNNLNNTYQYLDENDGLVTREKGNIYIDTNGDLIIEFDNIYSDEMVQIQIDQNGTIYEVTKE